ncbi:hypothetical protein [Bacillus toyonensis]|uniref:hypothetical protein n=1 Tax=Bacillus toyonensis TaxID=155322 RepID=UPI002E24C3E0|nr:hypothetical protein [Bacillus toyonensis]
MTIKFVEASWVSKYNNILIFGYRRSEDLASWETFYFNKETGRYVNFYSPGVTQWNYKPLNEKEIAHLLEFIKSSSIDEMDDFSDTKFSADDEFTIRMNEVLMITAKDFRPEVMN